MKTLKKLQILLDYYMNTRQVGHSTLIKKGFENFDREKLLLTYNRTGHPNIPTKKDEIISWNNLDKLRGCKKPLIIDNAVIYCILDDAIQRITELEEENKQLKIKF